MNWMNKMASILSGYGRMVIFETHSKMNSTYEFDPRIKFDPRHDNSTNHILEIREGFFHFGKLNGYGRILNAEETARVGFFKDDSDFGKMIYFRDGLLEKEGVAHNDSSFERLSITDLTFNVVDP